MVLADLRAFDLIYVGTPYSKYPGGLERAFADAARLTARLMQRGLKVYSPIAHTHPLAVYGNIDPYDHAIWLPFDEAIMAKSDAMIVARMLGWAESRGIEHEIEVFSRARKPIFSLDPSSLKIEVSAEVI